MYDEESATYEDPHVIASSSTGESSNRTLQCDFIETKDHFDVPQTIPRPRKSNATTAYQRLSDRYSFSFSADLIDQFDKYRAQMRESIRQELEADEKLESDKELKESEIIVMSMDDDEGVFSVHQVHHSNFGSNMYSQDSTRDIASDSAPNSCLPKSNQGRKSLMFSFLRGKAKPRHITASDMDNQSTSVEENETRIETESIEFEVHQQTENRKRLNSTRKILQTFNIFRSCTCDGANE